MELKSSQDGTKWGRKVVQIEPKWRQMGRGGVLGRPKAPRPPPSGRRIAPNDTICTFGLHSLPPATNSARTVPQRSKVTAPSNCSSVRAIPTYPYPYLALPWATWRPHGLASSLQTLLTPTLGTPGEPQNLKNLICETPWNHQVPKNVYPAMLF